MRGIADSVKGLQVADSTLADKVQRIEVLVAGQYVTKDDFAGLSTALFNKLDRIETKLDSKVDKKES